MILARAHNKKIESHLQEKPLEIYDSLIFFSCESVSPHRQDFGLIGDEETLVKHFAIMMNRHQSFKAIVLKAVTLEHLGSDAIEKARNEKN